MSEALRITNLEEDQREETAIEKATRESYADAIHAMESERPLEPRHLAGAIGAHRAYVHHHFPNRTQDERDETHRKGRAAIIRRYSEMGGKIIKGVA